MSENSKKDAGFPDWMYANSLDEARAVSSGCECGAATAYPKGHEYFHSYWCPLYKEKPKDETKKEGYKWQK